MATVVDAMAEKIRGPKTTKHFEELARMIRGELPPPPIAQLIGFTLVEIELGRAVFTLEGSPHHANPMGTMHGGVICDLADAAMGCAFASTLEDDESFTSIDLTTKFFKPVWNAKLRAIGTVVRRTRTLGHIECDVEDETGSLVAKVFSTCMVLRGSEAKGR